MSEKYLAIRKQWLSACAAVLVINGLQVFVTNSTAHAQVVEGQVVDANGAPAYQVDPFWPKTLPN